MQQQPRTHSHMGPQRLTQLNTPTPVQRNTHEHCTPTTCALTQPSPTVCHLQLLSLQAPQGLCSHPHPPAQSCWPGSIQPDQHPAQQPVSPHTEAQTAHTLCSPKAQISAVLRPPPLGHQSHTRSSARLQARVPGNHNDPTPAH